MKLAIFCTTFWDDSPAMADEKKPELLKWEARVGHFFPDAKLFLSTGCLDRPELNPTTLPMIQSGEPKTRCYDVFNWSYFLCAFESGLWYVWHTMPNIDAVIVWESNCWVNRNTNLNAVLAGFLESNYTMMSPQYFGSPDFNFMAIKRSGIHAFQHHRLRGNLVDGDAKVMIAEEEARRIFGLRWWNPWPNVQTIRQEYNVPGFACAPNNQAVTWPLIALPHPDLKPHIV